jgi:hypothetical protein
MNIAVPFQTCDDKICTYIQFIWITVFINVGNQTVDKNETFNTKNVIFVLNYTVHYIQKTNLHATIFT